MTRFSTLLFGLLLAGLFMLPAQASEPAEGIDYKVLERPVPTRVEDGQVEVLELFWYGCPHCYHFEPHVQAWKDGKPEHVQFEYLPAVFNDLWALHARVFYAAEAIGKLDSLHSPFFHAIHAQGRRMADERSILRFVEQQGVDPAEFRAALVSDEVTNRVREAIQQTRDYQVEGVPSVVVDGRYLVTASMAGGFEQMIKVMEHLVEKTAARTSAAR
ncbi:MAG: thiol:disulfide interchange protein DsbA/DsbL [Thioalkalivibrio sp.]